MYPKLKIKYWRKIRGYSQSELAAKIHTKQHYISELENNKKLPSVEVLYDMAHALEICPRQLIACELECNRCSYYNSTCDYRNLED